MGQLVPKLLIYKIGLISQWVQALLGECPDYELFSAHGGGKKNKLFSQEAFQRNGWGLFEHHQAAIGERERQGRQKDRCGYGRRAQERLFKQKEGKAGWASPANRYPIRRFPWAVIGVD